MENVTVAEKISNTQIVIHVIITVAFVIGALANILALCILYKSSKSRNNKHVLMLRCLATNDLVAQFGMLILTNLKTFRVIPKHWECILYVCLRAFGIGSGCVAFIMAVERWLALTRPFLYQTIVTYRTIKRCIFILWLSAVIFTYSPLYGFGAYYANGKCHRYRDASEFKDVVYAYAFFAFGSTLCFCIVYCNISIICEIWRIGKSQRALVRRCSRTSVNHKYSTAEEVAFAKLMAALCIIFIVCWMPQMISIPLAQFLPKSRLYAVFGKIADLLMCAYFALNPYVYVLQKYVGKRRCKLPCGKSSKLSNGSRSTSANGATLTTTAIIINLHDLTPLPERM